VRACVRLTVSVVARISGKVASHGVLAASPIPTAVLEITSEATAVNPVGDVELPGAAHVGAPRGFEARRVGHLAPTGRLTHAANALIRQLGVGESRKEQRREEH